MATFDILSKIYFQGGCLNCSSKVQDSVSFDPVGSTNWVYITPTRIDNTRLPVLCAPSLEDGSRQ